MLLSFSNTRANNNFQIAPVFFSKYKSNGGDWNFSKRRISINGIGLTAYYQNKNLELKSDYFQLFS